ncbi:hypothetical protein BJV77DRAFT_1068353 [Russula vinacea]|nr:hypothetical protein BJV77DRAFT_1068353 [Russula vinacea]
MYATCNGGNFTVNALDPGSSYDPPTGDAATDLCYCSTVGYSLLSGLCICHQLVDMGGRLHRDLASLDFPNPVPSGIRVPHWSILDVTTENSWNPADSLSAGDTPEILPGSRIGPTPSSGGKSSKAGAIAGGIAGGVAAIAIVIVVIFYLRRSQVPPAMSAGVGVSQSQQPLSDEVSPSGSPTTMRFYDPSDPTTFPGYQGSPHSPDISSQAHMSSYIGTGSSLGHTQTSLPQAMGYHGHPTV